MWWVRTGRCTSSSDAARASPDFGATANAIEASPIGVCLRLDSYHQSDMLPLPPAMTWSSAPRSMLMGIDQSDGVDGVWGRPKLIKSTSLGDVLGILMEEDRNVCGDHHGGHPGMLQEPWQLPHPRKHALLLPWWGLCRHQGQGQSLKKGVKTTHCALVLLIPLRWRKWRDQLFLLLGM